MLSYKEFKKQDKKVSKDISYSFFLESKKEKERIAQIPIEREKLKEQGLPVGLNKRKAEPTTMGRFVRGALTLGADVMTNIVNAEQIAVGKKETRPFSGGYLGEVKGLGKVDMTKSPLQKENLKTIKKSVATGLEIASYLNYGGVVKKTATQAISKLTETAAKQTFREFFVAKFPSLLKEGALTGLAYTGGSQLRENAETGKKFSYKQALIDVGASTVLTPVAALGLQRLFGKSAKKIIEARNLKRVEVLAKPIPAVGTKFDDIIKPAPKLLDETFIPTGGIKPAVKLQDGAFTPTVRYTPKTPLEIRASKFKTKEQFIGSEIQFLNRTKQKIPNNLQKQLKDTWDKVNTPIPVKTNTPSGIITPKYAQEITPEIGIKQPVITQPIKEIPPEQIVKDTIRMSETIEGFEPSTLTEWSKTIRQLPREEIENVAMGGRKTIQNTIPETGYLSVMKNIADETGDVKLAQKLSFSDLSSKSGQGLVANKLAVADNVTDDLRDVRLTRLKNKKISVEKFTQENSTLVEKIRSKITEMTNKIPTKQEFDEIISSLICK